MSPSTFTCLLLLLGVFSPLLHAIPHSEIAGERWGVSGRASCGCPIYSRQVFVGYDRFRRPIFKEVRQPFQCACDADSRHTEALRKHRSRCAKETGYHQERLRKAHVKYARDLEKAEQKHRSELAEIEQYRYNDLRKFHEKRASEYRDHHERLRKIEVDYYDTVEKSRKKYQRNLDESYGWYLKAIGKR